MKKEYEEKKKQLSASTQAMNKWATTKCNSCGGHGGGHKTGCSKKK